MEVVVVTNAQQVSVDGAETEKHVEYESDIARVTYPEPENETQLIEYATEHIEVFAQLAAAEEIAGTPTQNADKLARLMIENTALHETQDDIILAITDIMGGAEDAE